jgi:hypothetical protein
VSQCEPSDLIKHTGPPTVLLKPFSLNTVSLSFSQHSAGECCSTKRDQVAIGIGTKVFLVIGGGRGNDYEPGTRELCELMFYLLWQMVWSPSALTDLQPPHDDYRGRLGGVPVQP